MAQLKVCTFKTHISTRRSFQYETKIDMNKPPHTALTCTLALDVFLHYLTYVILERPSYGFQENYIGNEIKQENTKFRFVMLHREINQTKLRYYHKSQFTLKKSGQKIKHTCQKEDSHCAYPLVEVKGWQLHNQRC